MSLVLIVAFIALMVAVIPVAHALVIASGVAAAAPHCGDPTAHHCTQDGSRGPTG